MRFPLIAAACAAIALSGCENLSKPSTPSSLSKPAEPSKPSMPAKPEVSKPATPDVSKPATPDVSKPATPDVSKPATPDVSKPATPNVSKPASPDAPGGTEVSKAPAPGAAPIDKTPVKADLSKIKWKAEPAELFGYDDGESRAFFYANGLGEVSLKVPADGDYEIIVTASCQAAKGENAKFKLKVDGTQVGAETQLKAEDAKDYTFTAPLKAGDRTIGTEFTNDIYKEGEYDLNFYLHGVKVVRVK